MAFFDIGLPDTNRFDTPIKPQPKLASEEVKSFRCLDTDSSKWYTVILAF